MLHENTDSPQPMSVWPKGTLTHLCPQCGAEVSEWVRVCFGPDAHVEYRCWSCHWSGRNPNAQWIEKETPMTPETATRQARYVVRKADHVGGAPIPEDEPVLVIRAQDRLAVRMMRLYIDLYTLLDDYEEQVVDELNEHLDHLIEWQLEHPTKTADR